MRSLACSFAPPSSPLNLLRLPQTSSTTTCPDQVAYPMLKHFSRSGLDILPIFNLSWSLHSFPSIWKTHPQDEKASRLYCFLLVFLSHSLLSSQRCLNSPYYSIYSFFWSLIPFFLPARPVYALDGLLWIRDGQFRIPNSKDLNPKLFESNRIQLISCLQALSHCLFTDILSVKVSIACNDSKINSHTQTLIKCVRFLMMHTRADII